MIDHYRQQYHCEHGFAWLKSGADINPMFIETPLRIASMGFIYCIGLMTWNIIQRTVRAHLKATNSGLPYHQPISPRDSCSNYSPVSRQWSLFRRMADERGRPSDFSTGSNWLSRPLLAG
jgi:hypothetical protein